MHANIIFKKDCTSKPVGPIVRYEDILEWLDILDWPSQLPDLNPIEYPFHILNLKIVEGGLFCGLEGYKAAKFGGVDEPITAIAVIANKRYATKHSNNL